MTQPNPTTERFERDFEAIKNLDLDDLDYEFLADSKIKKLMHLAWLYGENNGLRNASALFDKSEVSK